MRASGFGGATTGGLAEQVTPTGIRKGWVIGAPDKPDTVPAQRFPTRYEPHRSLAAAHLRARLHLAA